MITEEPTFDQVLKTLEKKIDLTTETLNRRIGMHDMLQFFITQEGIPDEAIEKAFKCIDEKYPIR